MTSKRLLYIIMVTVAAAIAFSVGAQAQNVHRSATGLIVCGGKGNVRVMEPFGGSSKGGTWYSAAVNQYPRKLGGKVRVFCMVMPTAVEFYCPQEARSWTNPEKPTISNIYAHLSGSVTPVDVIDSLRAHTRENIYLRTDHHWAPLGAYYAAKAFAKVAGVQFPELDTYVRHVTRGYVGSMYNFSKEQAVKDSPEDFVYYVPRDESYTTTYVGIAYDKQRKRYYDTKEFQGPFFYPQRDGNPSAYITFMNGDMRTTHVHTNVGNGRRVLLIKDSYGNALASFLLQSFEDVYVVDGRYFTKNLQRYVRDNGITDVLIANNLLLAYGRKTSRNLLRLLNQ